MKKEDKKIILQEYYETLFNSWTYARMTPKEKEQLNDIKIWFCECGVLDKLNTEQSIIYSFIGCYHSFLIGIGYTGANWRETNNN